MAADPPATDGEGMPTEREWLEGVAADTFSVDSPWAKPPATGRLMGPYFDMAYIRKNGLCRHCKLRKATTEIEGRVLVCDDCANNEELREHARGDWR